MHPTIPTPTMAGSNKITFLLVVLFLRNHIPLSLALTSGYSLPHNISITDSPTHPAKPAATNKNPDALQTYIVRVHRNPSALSSDDRLQWYTSFLPADVAGVSEPRLVYGYSDVISGFAARLTPSELEEMKKKTGFVHAFPDVMMQLQTTHSQSFLGLNSSVTGFWNKARFGKGVIIGVLDSGISPNHPSFSGKGMPPPPAKWTGTCEFNASDCNNKLIGAREFVQGANSMRAPQSAAVLQRATLQGPYDTEGHGTHTASTTAGAFVDLANVDAQATGTASGCAPSAHLAIYRVCSEAGCAGADTLAALDAAIADGVDILSLSIGAPSSPFYEDSIAIGAFAAVQKGIFVSCAAGNNGPSYSTMSNEAPWILTVAASTTDRVVRTTVTLGSGDVFNGESLYQPRSFPPTQLPLIYPGLLLSDAAFCGQGSLDGIDVRGMVVLCDVANVDDIEKGSVVKAAGGSAMILVNLEDQGYTTLSKAHLLPVSHVSYSDGLSIKSYINSASVPTASIGFKGTLTGFSPAPAVAYFSSRGPNQADPNILKPDIMGPGVNILAAWPFRVGTTTSPAGGRFNVISGTSMATPHLSGIAALLKSAHPTWSPAAIKSAMMTSADLFGNDGKFIVDQNLNTADFFAVGAGHVNPAKASKPGLVYDIDPEDYIGYLCGLSYTDDEVSAVAGSPITCSDTTVAELNYPSFMVFLTADNSYTVQVTRTVTNVGPAKSSYDAQVTAPSGATVSVKPERLLFTTAGERALFSVTFTSQSGSSDGSATFSEGFLTWVSSDDTVTVNSPIMVAVQ